MEKLEILDTVIDLALMEDSGGEWRAPDTLHPAPELLVAFQEGSLAAERAGEIETHLKACPTCTQEVEDLRALDTFPPDAASLTPAEVEEDWQNVSNLAAKSRARPSPASAGRLPIYWLAASIVASFGLGLWSGTFLPSTAHHDLLREPTFLVDLVPDGRSAARNLAPGATILVPSKSEVLILRLNLGAIPATGPFDVEISDSTGGILWRQSAIEPQPGGEIVLLVPRSLFGGDLFRAQVTLQEHAEPAASFSFRLAPA